MTQQNGNKVKVTGTLPYEDADTTLGLPAGNRFTVKVKNSSINAQGSLPDGIIAKITNTGASSGFNTYDKTAFESDGSMIAVLNITNKNTPVVFKITWTEGVETVYTYDLSSVVLGQ